MSVGGLRAGGSARVWKEWRVRAVVVAGRGVLRCLAGGRATGDELVGAGRGSRAGEGR